ncbi:hypothetical protein Trydic_g5966 [Trypoxylus dichotomus]
MHIMDAIRSNQHDSLGSSNSSMRKAGVGTTALSWLTQRRRAEFKPINEGTVYVRLDMEPFSVSILSIYAPTENAKEEDEDSVYNKLEIEYDEIAKEDTIVILGDSNAQIHEKTNNKRVWLLSLAGKTYMTTINIYDLDNNMEIEETANEVNSIEVNSIEDIPTREEVQEIISKSRNGKAPGKMPQDYIAPRMATEAASLDTAILAEKELECVV